MLSLSDSNLSFLQDVRGDSISLAEYSSGRYLSSVRERGNQTEVDRVLSMIASRHYTGLGDASALVRITMLNHHHAPVIIRFARDLSSADLKSQNAILLGSTRSNPWVELLSKKSRFRIEYDSRLNRPFLRDTMPDRGKATVHMSDPAGEEPYRAYGLIACLENLDGTGNIIVVAGTNHQGTEAAGEFLTNHLKFDEFLTEKVGWHESQPIPLFEIVLALEAAGPSSISSEVVAYHIPQVHEPSRGH